MEPASPPVPGDLGGHRRILAAVVSQTTLLAALLFYFGWASTQAAFGYFGLHSGLLSLSVADYLLRGVRSAYPSLLSLGLVALLGLYVDRQLRATTYQHPHRRRLIAWLIASLGVLAVAGGLMAAAVTNRGVSLDPPLGSFLMFVGFALIAYAQHLGFEARSGPDVAFHGVVLMLALLSLIVATAAYATTRGHESALQFQRHLAQYADVVVYSDKDLGLQGPGLTTTPIVSLNTKYRFRYDGLRLLIPSEGRYFLLPKDWRPGAGAVIVLPDKPDDQTLRFEFRR